jgi:hypothetical protein
VEIIPGSLGRARDHAAEIAQTNPMLEAEARERQAATQFGGPGNISGTGHGSLVRFVISLNLHRRHLTSSQRATLAVELLPMLEAEAKERQLSTLRQNQDTDSQSFDTRGRAAQQAANLTDTNRQYVSDAKKLADEAPDLFEAVKSGAVSLPEAKRQHLHILSSQRNGLLGRAYHP